MRRPGAVALVLVLASVMFAPAASPARPRTIDVGGTALKLAGHGARTELLFVELYTVALYLPRPMPEPGAIREVRVPKALRVEIRYDGSLPDRIPGEWRDELAPALTQAQRRTLLRHYRQLAQGDVITIRYAPSPGTTVSVNGQPILQDRGHEVVDAFLDIWIGRTPVSQELKQSLLG